jgi:hypothetical protein
MVVVVVVVDNAKLSRFIPGKENRFPLYRRLGIQMYLPFDVLMHGTKIFTLILFSVSRGPQSVLSERNVTCG